MHDEAMNSAALRLAGYYDYRIVTLSALIAIMASVAALDLARRVTAARGKAYVGWLIGGATALGIGTWAMHYVGMLAFRLPVLVLYDWPTALLSFLPSLFASAVALLVVSREAMGPLRLWTGGIFMGGGISALHYTAMESMRLPAMCHYSLALVILSVALAIALSMISLWLMFRLREEAIGRRLRRNASALLMGAAICVMHYTGMASASFSPSTMVPNLSHAVSVSSLGIAGMGAVSLMVLLLAIVTTMVGRLQHLNEQLGALTGRLGSLREDERIRISRQIHDELGQRLTGLKMDLLRVEKHLGEMASSPSVNRVLDRVVGATEAVDEIIGTVQEIAAELRPGALDKLGLGAALQSEARRFQHRMGVTCNVRLPEPEPALSETAATELFRIFQECLTNVTRHAQATMVEAELRVEPGWITLRVEDNGRGITGEQFADPRALGLAGMKERAVMLGGEIRFEHGPERGTIVTVRIPFSGAEGREMA